MDLTKVLDEALLAKSPEEKRHSIGIVISAYRSMFTDIAYASMPITSGKLFYGVLEKYNVKNQSELLAVNKDALYLEIIKPNIESGIEFARELEARLEIPVLAPSVFEAKKQRWSQDEYMFLWYRVIEEMASEMHMMDGWEYSNGGTKEFYTATLMAFGRHHPFLYGGPERFVVRYLPEEKRSQKQLNQMRNIKTYSQSGEEIRLEEGVDLISSAIFDLEKRGFKSDPLVDILLELLDLNNSAANYSVRGQNKNPGFHAFQKPYDCDHKKINDKIWDVISEFRFTRSKEEDGKGLIYPDGTRKEYRYIERSHCKPR